MSAVGQQLPVLMRDRPGTGVVIGGCQVDCGVGDCGELVDEVGEVQMVPGGDVEQFVERLLLGAAVGGHHDALCCLESCAKPRRIRRAG
ncbi:hypothetical protein [Rhodococcus jostii]|uniref:hypothetical protein n=1 Tax=Rhodococcus jostii TaxID=132919 RepID=UPI00365D62AC